MYTLQSWHKQSYPIKYSNFGLQANWWWRSG